MRFQVSSPSTRSRFVLAALTILACSVELVRAQQTTNLPGDLMVGGAVDVNGSSFSLGTWSTDAGKYGLLWQYQETTDAQHAANISLTATRPNVTWTWQKPLSATSTGSLPQMTLSSTNDLTLYSPSSNPTAIIVLSPSTVSRFGNDVDFNGENNRMPNQTFRDDDSVLTVRMADQRYAVLGSHQNLSR